MCMNYFDKNPNIKVWSSEEIIVQYVSPIDGRVHKYYPDFKIKAINKQGELDTILIEVKPLKQTKAPTVQKRKTKRYINEVVTYGINEAKWKAARKYCKGRGWTFAIITEKELNL